MLDIYIPSHKRPRAPIIRKLIDAGIPFTIVLDHAEDAIAYRHLASGTTRLMRVDKALGIGYVRQKIKERYRGMPLIMLDDDTEMRIPKFDDPAKLLFVKTPEQTRKWFAVVDHFCADNAFDIGSVSDSIWLRENAKAQRVLHNTSCCSVTIFNSWRIQEIDYDPALYARMEDWDLIAQGITRKFLFLVCGEVQRHCPMNKAAKDKGGCSDVYRNDALMDRTYSYFRMKWGAETISFLDKKIGRMPDFRVNLKRLRARYGYDY